MGVTNFIPAQLPHNLKKKSFLCPIEIFFPFLQTLTRGQKLMEKIISKLGKDERVFPGDVAWRLYDTYGFPYDLTQLICEESGLTIDQAKYEESKAHAQAMSQATTQVDQDQIMLDVHSIDELKTKSFVHTDDASKYEYSFESGQYRQPAHKATITAIRRNKQFVDEVTAGQECGLLLGNSCGVFRLSVLGLTLRSSGRMGW